MSPSPRRVLIATRLYPPEVGAGAFRLQALADGIVAQGAESQVITTAPPSFAPAPVEHRGVTVSRAKVLRDGGGNVRGYVQYLSFDLPLFFRLLFRRADVVVSEPPPTTGLIVMVTSWLRRRPFVYYAADIWTDGLIALGAPRFMVATMRKLEGFVLRRAAATVAVSDEVADKVRAFGVPSERVSVVGNGVNTDIFNPDVPRMATSGPLFLYTGTMSEWQGPGIFIDAFARVLQRYPSARLQFFGQGAEEPALRKQVARLGLGSVEFGGVIPPAETAKWLRSATSALACIKPGLGYDFAKPTKTYAAAACGTPVIFAGPDAGRMIVSDNELGIGIDYDTDAVVAAMCTAIEQQDSGVTEAARGNRAAWARSNASIEITGTKAAALTLGTIPNSRRLSADEELHPLPPV